MNHGSEASLLHSGVHRLSRRILEPAQDVIVLGLGVVLFGLMIRTLSGSFTRSSPPRSKFVP